MKQIRLPLRVLVVSASPNKSGLTAACASAAIEGIGGAGGVADEIRLNDLQVGCARLVMGAGAPVRASMSAGRG